MILWTHWIWSTVLSTAFAQRPTSGGLFAFSSEDVIETYDDGAIRVHYSVSGPNVSILNDLDANGTPDYVEMVAHTANEVLDFYAELGFLYPLRESDVGLHQLGGSDAFDFYLVDFNGSSDGMFGVDACQGNVCGGYMVMENDFRGYGYPSLQEAVDVLTSHELFHAVQAAYNASQPNWMSEGTAVWAEWKYNPSVDDFFWFAADYIEQSDRSLYRPPSGVATSFVYGTGLFFAFMEEYYQEDRVLLIQEDMFQTDPELAIDVVLDNMDDVSVDWMKFAEWNLATGIRAGEIASYTFDYRLWGITEQIDNDTIKDDYRFYPLASSYFILQHAGGSLNFVYEGTEQDVQFAIYPVDESGHVLESIRSWRIGDEAIWTMELDAGKYWVVGALPMLADNSQKIDFCLGAGCEIPEIPVVDEDTTKSGCMHVSPGTVLWWSVWAMALGYSRRQEH